MRGRRGTGGRGTPMQTALRRCSLIVLGVGAFSGVINLLALTGSLYMLQVYDRVLPSRSVPTLVGLTVLMAGLYAAFGLLDFLRVRVMSRVGVRIDRCTCVPQCSRRRAAAAAACRARAATALQPMRDLDQIRSLPVRPRADRVLRPAVDADLSRRHLSAASVARAVRLGGRRHPRRASPFSPTCEAQAPHARRRHKSGSQRIAFGEAARRNAEVIRAMGMGPHLQRRWAELNDAPSLDQLQAADARRRHRHHLEGAAPAAAVGHARARRLSRHPGRG